MDEPQSNLKLRRHVREAIRQKLRLAVVSDWNIGMRNAEITLDGALGPLFAIAETTANPFTTGQNVRISFDAAEIRLVEG